jgi:20S proteasome subunit beta 2
MHLHSIIANVGRCAGAGTAADTDFTTSLISSNLALHSLSTGRTPRVITAVTQLKQYLFRYQGYIGAYLIVAGVDPTGTHLFSCQAHGSTDKLPYMTLGSGSLAAMGVLECEYKVGMEKEDAMDLVCRAVLGGVWNDLGSGGSVDLVIMEKDKVQYPFPFSNTRVLTFQQPTQVMRPYTSPNPPPIKQQSYRFDIATTKVLKQSVVRKFAVEGKIAEVVTEHTATDAMQLD